MELALKRNRNEAHPQILELWAAQETGLARSFLATCSPLPGPFHPYAVSRSFLALQMWLLSAISNSFGFMLAATKA